MGAQTDGTGQQEINGGRREEGSREAEEQGGPIFIL